MKSLRGRGQVFVWTPPRVEKKMGISTKQYERRHASKKEANRPPNWELHERAEDQPLEKQVRYQLIPNVVVDGQQQ